MTKDRYVFNEKDIKPYTQKSPNCPKCGSRDTVRHYQKGASNLEEHFYTLLDNTEFLKVTCRDCKYQWPQDTKEKK